MENEDLDCFINSNYNHKPIKRKFPISLIENRDENKIQRFERYIRQLSRAILSCSLCERGKQLYKYKQLELNPQVQPSIFYKDIIIIKEKLDHNDINGILSNISKLMKKYKISYDMFYYTSYAKCLNTGISECPYFNLEMRALSECDPKYIIIIGNVDINNLFKNSKIIKINNYDSDTFVKLLSLLHRKLCNNLSQ